MPTPDSKIVFQPTATPKIQPTKGRPLYFVYFILVALIAFAVIAWANFEFYQETNSVSGVQAVVGARPMNRVRLQVEFDATKRAFEGPVAPGMNVASALTQIATDGYVNLRIKDGKLLALAGKTSGSSGAWRVYLNGSPASAGLGEALHAGDRVVLRYE